MPPGAWGYEEFLMPTTMNESAPAAANAGHIPKIEFAHDGDVVVSCSCGWSSNIYFVGELQLAGRDFDLHFGEAA